MICDRCFHHHEAGDINEMLLHASYSDVDPMFSTV